MLERVIGLCWLLGMVSGCATSYRWQPAGRTLPPGAYETVEQRRWAHLFVFGLMGDSVVDLRDVCPGPLGEALHTGPTFETILVSVFSFGLYTPVEHRFTCIVPPPGPPLVPLAFQAPPADAPAPTPESGHTPDLAKDSDLEPSADAVESEEAASAPELVPPEEP